MKTSYLLVVCLTIYSTLASAQYFGLPPLETSMSAGVAQTLAGPAQATRIVDEFAPSTNDAFFPGGAQALERHLQTLDQYAYQARMVLVEGTVRVRFRVQASGKLTDIQVVKSQGALLDLAAIRVIERMPRWYPAHRSGVAVSSLVELPITFRLD